MVGPAVELWWTRAKRVSGGDAPIHCRAIGLTTGLTAGLPAGWRTGERGRFLRAVLGRYRKHNPALKVAAAGWRLNGGNGLHLSLTDSDDYLAAAIGRGLPVGVDLECLRPVDDPVGTLRELGLGSLGARLQSLPADARNRAFLMVWTAFEAFLKLERSPWEQGAVRFARMVDHWRIDRSGEARFVGTAQTGVAFQHCQPTLRTIAAIATPIACPLVVRTIGNRQKEMRVVPPVSSRRAER